jgi:hypothetical protein
MEVEMALDGYLHEAAESLLAQEVGQPLPIHGCLAMILADADAVTSQLTLKLSERLLEEFRDISNSNQTAGHDGDLRSRASDRKSREVARSRMSGPRQVTELGSISLRHTFAFKPRPMSWTHTKFEAFPFPKRRPKT